MYVPFRTNRCAGFRGLRLPKALVHVQVMLTADFEDPAGVSRGIVRFLDVVGSQIVSVHLRHIPGLGKQLLNSGIICALHRMMLGRLKVNINIRIKNALTSQPPVACIHDLLELPCRIVLIVLINRGWMYHMPSRLSPFDSKLYTGIRVQAPGVRCNPGDRSLTVRVPIRERSHPVTPVPGPSLRLIDGGAHNTLIGIKTTGRVVRVTRRGLT